MLSSTRTRKHLFGFILGPVAVACLLVLIAPASEAGNVDGGERGPAESKKAGSETTSTPAPQAVDCNAAHVLVSEADKLHARQELALSRAALDKYSQARACFESRKLPQEEADALRRMGEIYYEFGEYQRARECFQSALEKSKAGSDLRGQAEALAALGLIHILLDDIHQSLSYSDQALSLSRQLADPDINARILGNIGFAHYMGGAADKASEYLNKALVLADKTDNRATKAQILLYLGYLRQDGGQLNEALDLYQRSLRLWQGTNHPVDQSRTLAAVGGIFTAIGEAQKALTYNQEALDIQRVTGDRRGQAITFNNIGYSYKTLGNIDRALESYLQALASYEQLGHRRGQAQTNLFVGNMYRLLGDSQKARTYYEHGQSISKELNDKVLEALSLNNIGLLVQSEGKTRDAVSNYQQALAKYREVGNRRGQALALNNLGYAMAVLDEKQPALEQLLQALPIVEASQDHELEVLVRYNLARVERSLEKLDEARSHLEAAIQLIESFRIKLDQHELRTLYFASVRQFYDLDIDVLMQMHKQSPAAGWDAEALGVSERARARSLLELLKEAGADIQQGVDPALLTKRTLLERELDTRAQTRLKLITRDHKKEELATLDNDIRNLTEEFHQVEGKIRDASPRYHKLAQPSPLRGKEIQAQVTSDTLLLEYTLGDARSFVWAVTPDSIKGFELQTRPEIEAAVASFTNLLAERTRNLKDESPEQWRRRLGRADAEYSEASAALSKMVVEPVAALLGNKRLVIVADGALQLVPFAALSGPNSADGKEPNTAKAKTPDNAATNGPRPLIKDHEIVYEPSASVLALQRKEFGSRQPARHALAVLADPVFDQEGLKRELENRHAAKAREGKPQSGPDSSGSSSDASARTRSDLTRAIDDVGIGPISSLPESREEAAAIMKVVPKGEGLSALGFDASRATVMSANLSQYRIIHFATHGFADLNHPELSGIVLSLIDAKGQPQDGYLRLHDIYNLNLPADLVVLSACQTGVGKQIKGEGLIALTRGFTYAGAARVVASLWKVDDEATKYLMEEFYKQMFRNGLKPGAALQQAQLKLSHQSQWHSPFYWAGFVLQGEWK